MPQLTIERPWAYFGAGRKLDVLVNSKKVGTVKTRHSFDYELPEGQHVIQVSMDGFDSIPLDINLTKNDNLQLSVKTQRIPLALINCFFKPSKVFSLRAN